MQRSGKEVVDSRRREFIGLEVRVVASGDPGLVGLEGLIVDETKHTFVVERPGGREARIGKKGQTFSLAFPEGPVLLAGEELNHAPQNRIKKSR